MMVGEDSVQYKKRNRFLVAAILFFIGKVVIN